MKDSFLKFLKECKYSIRRTIYRLTSPDEIITQNGRIYSRKKLRKQLKKYVSDNLAKNPNFGELDHLSPNNCGCSHTYN